MLKDKASKLFENAWTLPNLLSLIRLLLVPVFAVVFLNGYPKTALIVFAAASLTDLFDGFLARKLKQISDLGKLLDPLADKLMVLTALICQGIAGVFPWLAVCIVAGKELLMMLGSLVLLKRNIVVYSNLFGKAAQVFFILSLVLSFFHDELAAWGTQLDIILLWITVALALTALFVYAWKAIQVIRQKKSDWD